MNPSLTTPDLMIIGNVIAARSASPPELDVLTFVDIDANGDYQQEVRTDAQLWRNGQCVTAALDDAGMRAGDAFGVVLLNHPEFVDTLVGSSIAGTVFVPIDARTRGKKLAYMLAFAGCRGRVIGDYALAKLADILGNRPQLEWVWVVGTGSAVPPALARLRVRPFADILARPPTVDLAVRVASADQPMQMLYTSGTTGDPKAILSPYVRFGFVGSLGAAFGLRAADRPYTGLSLTHANAQLITLGTTLTMGLRGVFSRRFTKSRLWDITRRYGCTMFNLLGGMTTATYSEPVKSNDADNPVRYVLSAGMPATIWAQFKRRFNVEIFEFYGAAEGGLTMHPPGAGPAGSIGRPPPSMIGRIVDDRDNEVAAGAPGEIVFRNADGSCPAVAYFNNADATASKTAGGWLRMGDIGYRDADGWYYFLFRQGGGSRHNGDFVNPAFVEKELAEHPLVDDVFVYGVPSANGVPGEKDVVAAVVPLQGVRFDAADVFHGCRQRLEASCVPAYLQMVEEIPKTASEKPQERFLLEAFDAAAPNILTEAKLVGTR